MKQKKDLLHLFDDRKENMKIAEMIEDYQFKGKSVEDVVGEILALIPANMEVPALEECAGPLSIERRNLILGRNAGLDEVRVAMGVKNDR